MKNGCYYLNNSGHRWVLYYNGEKERVRVLFPDGHIETRAILYCEAFGNWAVVCISLKGKKKKFFQKSIILPNGEIFDGIVLDS